MEVKRKACAYREKFIVVSEQNITIFPDYGVSVTYSVKE